MDLETLKEATEFNFSDISINPDFLIMIYKLKQASISYLEIQEKSDDREAAIRSLMYTISGLSHQEKERACYNFVTAYFMTIKSSLQSPPSELLDKVESALKSISVRSNPKGIGGAFVVTTQMLGQIADHALSLIQEYKNDRS